MRRRRGQEQQQQQHERAARGSKTLGRVAHMVVVLNVWPAAPRPRRSERCSGCMLGLLHGSGIMDTLWGPAYGDPHACWNDAGRSCPDSSVKPGCCT